MNVKTGAVVLAGVLFGAAALVPVVTEGRGRGPGGRGNCNPGECRRVNPGCPQDRKGPRDGSCDPACPQDGSGRNCPGPGSKAPTPQDGTGKGVPSRP
jgi:hypothetical protein